MGQREVLTVHAFSVLSWEHRNTESGDLRFDFSRGLRVFLRPTPETRWKNNFLYSFTEPKILPSFFFLLQNMTLTTLLILAVCRTRIMHELRSWPCPPQTLRASVVEHQRAESEDFRSDSHGDSEVFLCLTLVKRRKKNLFIYFFSGLEI